MNIAIIQARMNSKRLPGKVMKKIGDCPILSHVIKQTFSSKMIDDVVVATSVSKDDKIIADYCKKNKIKFFTGSEHDVLDRFYKCAKKFNCDPVIRISADSPFIDPTIIDRVLKKFQKNSFDYVSNNIEKMNSDWKNSTCNFAVGTVIEVSTFDALKTAWKNAKRPSEREHVFPYIQFNPELFTLSNVMSKKNFSNIRITVDRSNDLKFVREVYSRFNKKKKYITITDINKILKKEPKLLKINSRTDFEEGYKKSLKEDQKKGFKK